MKPSKYSKKHYCGKGRVSALLSPSGNAGSHVWLLNIKETEEKQARKSSEDTHFTESARFEKVWAG